MKPCNGCSELIRWRGNDDPVRLAFCTSAVVMLAEHGFVWQWTSKYKLDSSISQPAYEVSLEKRINKLSPRAGMQKRYGKQWVTLWADENDQRLAIPKNKSRKPESRQAFLFVSFIMSPKNHRTKTYRRCVRQWNLVRETWRTAWNVRRYLGADRMFFLLLYIMFYWVSLVFQPFTQRAGYWVSPLWN